MDDKDWDDLITHRKKAKAVNSARALEILRKELEKAHIEGWEGKEIVDEVINRGWRGFKAEWLRNKKVWEGKYSDTTAHNLRVLGEWVEQGKREEVIEGEARGP